jgi:TonB family protein
LRSTRTAEPLGRLIALSITQDLDFGYNLVMSRISYFVFFVLFLSAVSASGQIDTEKYSAPVAWKEYRISSQKLSFSFPKLPLIRTEANLCAQLDGRVYYAYANGTVYEFEWHTKSHESVPDFCPQKSKFSKASLDTRIAELKAQNWAFKESDETIAGLPAKVLRSTSSGIKKIQWLIWDTDRWLELGITRRGQTNDAEAGFLAGLKLKSSTGIDVGNGAEAMAGDPDADVQAYAGEKISSGLVIVSKPRPRYTDTARQSSTQGTVILRVTFLKNGGIGPIVPVKELANGLTENAISAAKRVAFLPAIVDGTPVSVTKQIEYTFSIY